jgi:hypothetical protein
MRRGILFAALALLCAGCSSLTPVRDARIVEKGQKRWSHGILVDSAAIAMPTYDVVLLEHEGRTAYGQVGNGGLAPTRGASYYLDFEMGLGSAGGLGPPWDLGLTIIGPSALQARLRRALGQTNPTGSAWALALEGSGGLYGSLGALSLTWSLPLAGFLDTSLGARSGWLYHLLPCACAKLETSTVAQLNTGFADLFGGFTVRPQRWLARGDDAGFAPKWFSRELGLQLGVIWRHPFAPAHPFRDAPVDWSAFHRDWIGYSAAVVIGLP